MDESLSPEVFRQLFRYIYIKLMKTKILEFWWKFPDYKQSWSATLQMKTSGPVLRLAIVATTVLTE